MLGRYNDVQRGSFCPDQYIMHVACRGIELPVYGRTHTSPLRRSPCCIRAFVSMHRQKATTAFIGGWG